MTSAQHAQALDELAEALGVTRGYHDGTGQWRRACDEAVIAVVRSLGAPLERIDDAPEALRSVRATIEDSASRRAPAVATVTSGEGGSVLFPCTRPEAARVRLVLESGDSTSVVAEAGCAGFAQVHVPRHIPSGYHNLEIEDGSELARVHVLVAPARLPSASKSWGLFAPLYALHTGTEEGRSFATYSDIARLSTWMLDTARDGERDAAYLGTLPLLACYFEEPFEPSPYSPISRAFWSELYVDPAAAVEFDARDAVSLPSPTADTRGLIDYRHAMRERRAGIEALLRRLDERGGRRRDAFENALEDDEELARYAAFRACVERQGTTWQSWPTRARDGQLRPGSEYDGEAFRYHAYAQWLAREQIAAAATSSSAGLYLDLPLGSHGGGYDTWRHRDDFVGGVSVGAPPDAVFDGGQDWGFPPLHPERARAHCYAGVRAALKHHFEHAALLRVDHVMGLHRLFWIPEGFTAADGVYVRSRADELWSILAIEAARARGGKGAAVVGEDLGTVPDEVRAEMNRRGALRMFVVPFEGRDDAAAPIASPQTGTLACLGTHDMEPFAAWWDQAGTRRGEIAAFVGCNAETATAADVLPALLAWLSAGDATIVVANLEDLWLETRRQNLPGTEAADRNWKRPFARSFDEFSLDSRVRRLVAVLAGNSTVDSRNALAPSGSQHAPSLPSAGGAR